MDLIVPPKPEVSEVYVVRDDRKEALDLTIACEPIDDADWFHTYRDRDSEWSKDGRTPWSSGVHDVCTFQALTVGRPHSGNGAIVRALESNDLRLFTYVDCIFVESFVQHISEGGGVEL
jgi:hypothetical protein